LRAGPGVVFRPGGGADTHLHHAARRDQPFLDGVPEHRAMGENPAKIILTGAQMRINMERPQRFPDAFILAGAIGRARCCLRHQKRRDGRGLRPVLRSVPGFFSISPSAISNSPRSERSSDAGGAPVIGCRSSVNIRAAARMARGPSRGPARLVVPISSGKPAMQKAKPRSCGGRRGRRAGRQRRWARTWVLSAIRPPHLSRGWGAA